MDAIKSWVRERFTPVVLVATTPAIDAMCHSTNGLSIVDILRPLGHISRLEASIRVNDTTIKLQDIKLRFYHASTMFQPSAEACDQQLQRVLQLASQQHAGGNGAAQLKSCLETGKAPAVPVSELTPWSVTYQQELMRLLAWGEHEAVDYPVAALLVIPADASSPVQHINALLAQMAVPPLMQQEVMQPVKDPDFPKFVLLLQDASSGLVEDRRAAEALAAVRKAYGEGSAALLKLNTGLGDASSQGAPPDLFRKLQGACLPGGGAGEPPSRPPPPAQGLGALLAGRDLEALAAALRVFARMLLPRLEDRLARLNAGITATRRGLRNRLTRFWKGAAEENSTDKPYPWHSTEGQLRQLADLAFMLRAYDFAAATYRLAAQDYLAASNSRWYAGVEEMLGLCVLMSPDDNDPQKYFQRAYEHYAKLPGKPARMLASRAALLSATYLQAAARFLPASVILMRAHFEEENARAALLLEQSAYCLLYPLLPSQRKFAFQMVLAGLRYHAAGQKRLAIQAYRQVLGSYQGRRWRAIEEHLNDILGKQSRESGEDGQAALHFLALLQDCSAGRPAATQAHYLSQFLEAARKVAAKELPPGTPFAVPGLQLPLVDAQEASVVFSDSGCAGNAAAHQVPPGVWLQLEACCCGDTGNGSSNWLDAAAAPVKQETAEHEEFNAVVVGEPVSVRVQFRNPLAVKLRVSAVRLMCEFTPQAGLPASAEMPHPVTGGAEQQAAGPLPGLPVGPHDPHPLAAGAKSIATANRHNHPLLEVADVSLTLHPGEVLSEMLSVTPRVPGTLRISGVTWLLADCLEGCVTFNLRGRHRKHPKGSRPAQQKHFAPHRRLVFSVVGALPRLELAADSMPGVMYAGEVSRVVMVVRNTGSLPCRNLQLVASGPELCCPAAPTGQDLPLIRAVADTSHVIAPERLPASCQGSGAAAYRPYPRSTVLGPGQEVQCPLWLHPTQPGSLNLQLLWYCEPLTCPPGSLIRFRTLRLAYCLHVAPLLLVRPSAQPCPGDVSAHLLRMDLELVKDGEATSIEQVTALSQGRDAGWRLLSAQAHASLVPDAPLPPHTQQQQQQRGADSTRPGQECGHTLLPRSQLIPGQSLSSMLVLRPPTHTPGLPACPPHPPSSPPALLPLMQPGLSGPLAHWYGPRPPPQPTTSRRTSNHHPPSNQGPPAPAPPLPLAPRLPAQEAAGGQPPQCPDPSTLHADPALDLLLVWRTLSPDPSSREPRLGLLLLRDLTATAQPPPQPIRLALRVAGSQGQRGGPAGVGGGGGSAVVVHDFRHAPMALVQLSLAVRNCSAGVAAVQVEAGQAWDAGGPSHAWALTAPGAVGRPALEAPAPGPLGGAQQQQQQQGVGGGQGARGPLVPAGLEPSTDYMWCGRTFAHIHRMPPGCTEEVPLQLAVFWPGTYAVGGCYVHYTIDSAHMSMSESQRVEKLLLRVEAA